MLAQRVIQRHSDNQDTENQHFTSSDPSPQSMRMGDVTNNNMNTQSIADYLAQLLKDKKQLAAFPNVFIHMERLLDEGECGDSVILVMIT